MRQLLAATILSIFVFSANAAEGDSLPIILAKAQDTVKAIHNDKKQALRLCRQKASRQGRGKSIRVIEQKVTPFKMGNVTKYECMIRFEAS